MKQICIYQKQTTITTQSRDDFANENIPREGIVVWWNCFQIQQIECMKPKNRKPVLVRFYKSITLLASLVPGCQMGLQVIEAKHS